MGLFQSKEYLDRKVTFSDVSNVIYRIPDFFVAEHSGLQNTTAWAP
jgi:hypothetical protein